MVFINTKIIFKFEYQNIFILFRQYLRFASFFEILIV